MKNWIVLLLMCMMVAMVCQPAKSDNKKKKKAIEEQVTAPAKKLTKYERLFKGKKTQTAQGKFLTLHKVDGKLYVEMPLSMMGREMLLASTTTETSDNSVATNGYKVKDPLHICFTLRDSLVQMRKVNSRVSYNVNDARLRDVVAHNFVYPVLEGYKVLAYTPDSSSVVFDMTDMFTGGDAALSPIVEEMFPMAYRAVISRPLKSPLLRDIVQPQYLAYFLNHVPKSFHGSSEVIGRCRQKHVHSIPNHTLIKVAAQSVI